MAPPARDADTREADTTTAGPLECARHEAGDEVVRAEPSKAIEVELAALWGETA